MGLIPLGKPAIRRQSAASRPGFGKVNLATDKKIHPVTSGPPHLQGWAGDPEYFTQIDTDNLP